MVVMIVFVVDLVFTDKIGYKAVCTNNSDMRNNVCFMSFGMISIGIVAVGQVAIGCFALGQAALGIFGALGQGVVTLGFTGGQICFATQVKFAQVSIALYRTEAAQLGISLLDPFLTGGKLLVDCSEMGCCES